MEFVEFVGESTAFQHRPKRQIQLASKEGALTSNRFDCTKPQSACPTHLAGSRSLFDSVLRRIGSDPQWDRTGDKHSGRLEVLVVELVQAAHDVLVDVLEHEEHFDALRYFTGGAVIGSKEFVNAFFKVQRERFSEKRKDGARCIRQVEGDLHSQRDLMARVSETSFEMPR